MAAPAAPDPRDWPETLLGSSGFHGRRLAHAGRPGGVQRLAAPTGLAHGTSHAERMRAAASVLPISVVVDESEMLLRPALPHDAGLMSADSDLLSPETFYRRFMSHSPPTPAMAQYLFELDYLDHFAWVVVDPITGAAAADGRYVRDSHDSHCAEIAFTVADAYQGKGIGRLLLDAVMVAADIAGLKRLTARMFVCNAPMRALLDGLSVTWSLDEPGVMSGSFDIPGHGLLRAEPALVWQMRVTAAQAIHMGYL